MDFQINSHANDCIREKDDGIRHTVKGRAAARSPVVMVWHASPDDAGLAAAEVHVWRADLDQPTDRMEQLRATFSGEEGARATRLGDQAQRNRFVVARGVLRVLLGRYLSCDPNRVHLGTDEGGKPYLEDDALSFNLSHAGALGVFAFTLDRRIGVDVESASRNVAVDRIARRFFATSEASRLHSLQEGERHRAFLRCWTHKEAYLKATGEGIASGALSRFEVSVDPRLPARLERVEGAADEVERWRLEDLPLDGSDYIGAVCVEGQDWRLRCLQFGGET